MDKIVLQKFMANAGINSRRKCEELISQGKVRVNGKVASLGTRVSPSSDTIIFEGKKIELKNTNKIYIMIYKPRGFITTLSDEHGRKCILELVKDIPERIFPVGRLDKNSEGLLLMTNDGDFANKVIHPSKNIRKSYRVTIKSNITEDQLINLSSQTDLDGEEIQPAIIEVLSKSPERTVLKISIKEGKNRQIRKMCEKVGLEVARLKRISIGQLKLGMLSPGKWRNLTKQEINYF